MSPIAPAENDVQPILEPLICGQERTLLPHEHRLLASWAVKTALMLDLASGTPVVPTGFYHEFRQRKTALPSNVVWVGAYCGSHWAAWARHAGLHIDIADDQPPDSHPVDWPPGKLVFGDESLEMLAESIDG